MLSSTFLINLLIQPTRTEGHGRSLHLDHVKTLLGNAFDLSDVMAEKTQASISRMVDPLLLQEQMGRHDTRTVVLPVWAAWVLGQSEDDVGASLAWIAEQGANKNLSMDWTRPLVEGSTDTGIDIMLRYGTPEALRCILSELPADRLKQLMTCEGEQRPAISMARAIAWDRFDQVDVLMSLGCSIDQRDENGATPLVLSKNLNQLSELVQRGADIWAHDRQGQTAWTALAHWGKRHNEDKEAARRVLRDRDEAMRQDTNEIPQTQIMDLFSHIEQGVVGNIPTLVRQISKEHNHHPFDVHTPLGEGVGMALARAVGGRRNKSKEHVVYAGNVIKHIIKADGLGWMNVLHRSNPERLAQWTDLDQLGMAVAMVVAEQPHTPLTGFSGLSLGGWTHDAVLKMLEDLPLWLALIKGEAVDRAGLQAGLMGAGDTLLDRMAGVDKVASMTPLFRTLQEVLATPKPTDTWVRNWADLWQEPTVKEPWMGAKLEAEYYNSAPTALLSLMDSMAEQSPDGSADQQRYVLAGGWMGMGNLARTCINYGPDSHDLMVSALGVVKLMAHPGGLEIAREWAEWFFDAKHQVEDLKKQGLFFGLPPSGVDPAGVTMMDLIAAERLSDTQDDKTQQLLNVLRGLHIKAKTHDVGVMKSLARKM